MNIVKIALVLLTTAILLTPLAVEALMYQDNLLGLILPKEITDLINNQNPQPNSPGSILPDELFSGDFVAPQPVGDPKFNPDTNTVSYTFNFTNPLKAPLEVDTLQATLVSKIDGQVLGNITIDKPIKLEPGQSADITTLGILSLDAISYLKEKALNQESINLDLKNLVAEVGGVKVEIDQQNIGEYKIPAEIGDWLVK